MKKKNERLSADWVTEKLNMLKDDFESLGKWPESADQIWQDLMVDPQEDNDETGDEAMLSIVLSDALNGVDIAERYPAFYRRMLNNPEIFQAFLDAVEIMEADAAGLLEPLPVSEVSLPEKLNMESGAVLMWKNSKAWLARWQKSIQELNTLFNTLSPIQNIGYRAGWNILEGGAVPVLRSDVSIDASKLGILLTAAWAEDPDMLQLKLTVAFMAGNPADFALSTLAAGLSWGEYKEESSVDEYGLALFPLLPLSAITNETGQEITGDLQLQLFTVN